MAHLTHESTTLLLLLLQTLEKQLEKTKSEKQPPKTAEGQKDKPKMRGEPALGKKRRRASPRTLTLVLCKQNGGGKLVKRLTGLSGKWQG